LIIQIKVINSLLFTFAVEASSVYITCNDHKIS